MYKNTCIEILNVHSLHPNGYELTPLSQIYSLTKIILADSHSESLCVMSNSTVHTK